MDAGEESGDASDEAGLEDAAQGEFPDLDGSLGDADKDAAADDGASAEAGSGDAAVDGDSGGDATVDAANSGDDGSVTDDGGSEGSLQDAELGDADTVADEAGSDGSDVDGAVATKRCASGLYVGTFEGNLRATIGLLVIDLPPVTGEVQLLADESEEGGQLVIDDGTLSAVDNEGDSVYARISGVVNCETGVLEDGKLTDGFYRRESLDQTVEFEGTVAGVYEHEPTPHVTGTWEVDGRYESGQGTFEVHLKSAAP